jgi:cob(I)alamin adenosyltransferase
MADGMIHIYTGNGKGKTTAATGLAIRATGRGMKVLFIQCLKGTVSGEVEFMKKHSSIKVYRKKDIKGFVWNMSKEQKEKLKEITDETFRYFTDNVNSDTWDMIVFDEIMGAISNELIDTKKLLDVLKNKPEKLEIVLTGRNAPDSLVEIADYVSNIDPVKHPAHIGVPPRKGIEL